MSKELSVNNIMNEISDVLRKHLISIIEKNKNDKKDFENFIKNLPFIKKILEENETLKNEIEKHKEQIIFLNNNLTSLSKQYTQVFFSKNKLKASVSLDNVLTNDEFQATQILEKDENGSENIELIVDDTKSEINEINEKDIIKEVEENLEKKKNDLLKSTAMDMYLNNYELEDDLSVKKFDILNYDEEDEEDEEEDEEDEEDDEEDVGEEGGSGSDVPLRRHAGYVSTESDDGSSSDSDGSDFSDSDLSDMGIVRDKKDKIKKILYYIAKVYPDKWEQNKDTLHRILINYLRSKPKKK